LEDEGKYASTYSERYTALNNEIKAASGDGANWWFETTSFITFTTNEAIDAIVDRVKRSIDETGDLVVIGNYDVKQGRIVGHLKDRDLLSLVPSMKEV